MTMIDSQIEYILNDIRNITENVVVKIKAEADKYETVDSRREGDRYVSAVNEVDIFESHSHYDRDELMAAGINDVEFIEECYYDKYKIPSIKRPLVLQARRENIKKEFEETNDYYRELIGKPPMDTKEEDYIYLTKEQMDYYKIDEVRPIHEYPLEILIKLERYVIPSLIEQYPDRGYLKRLGSKSVNIVRARSAKNFEIIFSDASLDNVFLRSFFETYDFCREYFMSVIYNNSFSEMYALYDNFIGMHIMVMAIQRMIVNTIKLSIDRDFYDLNSIKKMFDCYGVPFFEDLPLDYQRAIIKSLNVLIRTKSTDKCLYDISNILMYERIKIYKYFLVRERRLDKDNNPIEAEKPEYNDEGEVTGYVPDYEKMYDVYFQSTDIMEPNVILAMENKPNRYGYLDVTEDDMLWWDTDDLRHELYEREFNFIDTKYLGVNVMYNLTDLLYETTYVLNMLIDNKDTTEPNMFGLLNSDAMKTGTDYLYITLERITPIPVSIFDAVVILCAMVSKKNNMKGNIIAKSPAKILSVLGFNFEANFDLIKKSILENPRIFKQPEIVRYLDLLDIKKVEDIETLYKNFRNFADFCVEQIATTQNIKEYHAYKQLYKVFTVREETGEAFTMSNGKMANTFMEYLRDKLPHIAEFVDDTHKDKLGVYIEHVIGKLNELIPDLTYMSAINGTNNNIVRALVALVNFFKSYTTDLRNLNVVYIFNDKYNNMIRMVDDPRLFIKIFPVEKVHEYIDGVKSTSVNYSLNDNLTLDFLARFSGNIKHIEKVIFKEMATISEQIRIDDPNHLNYSDMVHVTGTHHASDNPELEEKFDFESAVYGKEKAKFKCVADVTGEMNMDMEEYHPTFDNLMIGNEIKKKDTFKLGESLTIIYED